MPSRSTIGGGNADALVPATLNGEAVPWNAGGFVTKVGDTSLTFDRFGYPFSYDHNKVNARLRYNAQFQVVSHTFIAPIVIPEPPRRFDPDVCDPQVANDFYVYDGPNLISVFTAQYEDSIPKNDRCDPKLTRGFSYGFGWEGIDQPIWMATTFSGNLATQYFEFGACGRTAERT
jgi:hypothetical protein